MYINKKNKKTKRKYLQPCKYSQMVGLDVQKMRLERYYMPVALDVEGGAGKGKLDKKVVEVQDDMTSFYLNTRTNWKQPTISSFHNSEYSQFSYKQSQGKTIILARIIRELIVNSLSFYFLKNNYDFQLMQRVRSQLQIQVLRFYREAWKFTYSKPQPLRKNLQDYIQRQFAKHRDIPRIKFHKIEYQLRVARNRLNMMKNTQIDNISFL